MSFPLLYFVGKSTTKGLIIYHYGLLFKDHYRKTKSEMRQGNVQIKFPYNIDQSNLC